LWRGGSPSSPSRPCPPINIGYKCDADPSLGLPRTSDLDRSIYEIRIGTTTLYASGYTSVATNRNARSGATASGCYLRLINVPLTGGGSSEACMQFCKTEACPKNLAPPPQTVVSATPAPAQPQGKAAIKTVIAGTFVEPMAPGKPAIKTVVAKTLIEPEVSGKPATKSVVAPSFVEP